MLHGDLLGERARLTPTATALVEAGSGRRYTYAELDSRATAWARLLRGLGLAAGETAGLLCGNRVDFLDVFFAAGKSGVVLVPLNTRLAAPELEQIVRDSGMRVLIHDGGLADTVRRLKERVELDAWVALDEPLNGDRPAGALLSAQGDGAFEGVRPAPEDLHCLLYTSGTTGNPKGVMIPHRMVTWNGYNTVVCWQLTADDVSPIFTPLYHAGGLGAFLIPIFTVGGTIVLHEHFDAEEVWTTIERERCTVVLGVPTIWKMLADSPAFRTADLSHLRWLISGGAPLPPSLIDRYRERGVVLRQGYGLTEAGVNCFAMTDRDAWERPGSIGKPLMFTEARIVDADGHELPAGEVGELLLRGPHLSSGYWRNPGATAAAYDREGWFHTGDLARRDGEGFFYIAGRLTEMFISGGVNIHPAEVESALGEHPAVAEAAVVGIPHPTWGEVGVALVVPRTGTSPSSHELATFLETRIAPYKIPKRFVLVGEIPRTAYGKVKRAGLIRRLAREGEGR
ncbi:MAG: long-chain fatty acid--CoA ligase [Acidobacteria bacterium]|nr:long-chain fatty acid--CoA ligase [Acidobacteriota bacterium]